MATARASERRNGPCRDDPPHSSTETDDGKGRGEIACCTTRPRSGACPPPQAAGAQYFAMDAGEDVGEAPAAERPAPLLEVLAQEWVQRRTVEQIVDPVPVVPMLQVFVPQMVEQLVDILAPLDFRIAEQVIDVPKILCPPRAARTVLREPQTVDQLVEVPTIVSWSLLQRIMEQHVDIPVPGGGERSAGLQGFLPGQSSTSLHGPQERISERNEEQIAVSRVGDGLQDFLPGQSSTSLLGPQERISERNVEQIAVSRVGEGLHDFLPGQSSASSSRDPARGFEALDELGYVVFSHFSPNSKKCDTTSALEVGTASALEPMDAVSL